MIFHIYIRYLKESKVLIFGVQFLYRFKSFEGKYIVLLGALDIAAAFATFLYV
jgi:hypothetical protein